MYFLLSFITIVALFNSHGTFLFGYYFLIRLTLESIYNDVYLYWATVLSPFYFGTRAYLASKHAQLLKGFAEIISEEPKPKKGGSPSKRKKKKQTNAFTSKADLVYELHSLKKTTGSVMHSSQVSKLGSGNLSAAGGSASTNYKSSVMMSVLNTPRHNKPISWESLSEMNQPYHILKLTQVKNLPQLDLVYTVNDLNRLGTLDFDLLSKVTQDNSSNNIAKQSRWLVKNLSSSRNLTSSNFAITSSKKLIGNSLESVNTVNRNL